MSGYDMHTFYILIIVSLIIMFSNVVFCFFVKKRRAVFIAFLILSVVWLSVNLIWYINFVPNHLFYPAPEYYRTYKFPIPQNVLNRNHQLFFILANTLLSTTITYLLYLMPKRKNHG